MQDVAENVLLQLSNNGSSVHASLGQWPRQLPPERGSVHPSHNRLLGEVFGVTNYHFDDFVTEREHCVPRELKRVVVVSIDHSDKGFYRIRMPWKRVALTVKLIIPGLYKN